MINTCRGEGKLTNDCRKRGSMAGDFALGSMLGCVGCCTVFRTTEKSKTEWTAMWERRIRIWRTIFTIKKLLIIFAVDFFSDAPIFFLGLFLRIRSLSRSMCAVAGRYIFFNVIRRDISTMQQGREWVEIISKLYLLRLINLQRNGLNYYFSRFAFFSLPFDSFIFFYFRVIVFEL